MRKKHIVFKYMLGEMLPPFGVTLLVFALIFLMTRMLQLTDYVVNFRVGLGHVMMLLMYSMPFFLIFVIPMSTMMAVLLTFLRMSSDNEITALKAAGWSLYSLLPPVLAFCTAAALLTASMSFIGLPWGRMAAKELLIDVARQNVEIGLKERSFERTFKNVVLYVGSVDVESRTLHHVFIEDRRDRELSSTIMASTGRIIPSDGDDIWQLRLNDGVIVRADRKNQSMFTVDFDSYDFNLNLGTALGARDGEKDEEEMYFKELLTFVKRYNKKDDRYYLALLEVHKKFSIPFSCIVLGLAAVPLGIVSRSARRSFGVALGLGLFLLYYLLLSAGWVFGEAGKYPPMIGMWVPNLVIGAMGGFSLVRMAKDRPVALFAWFQNKARILSGKWGGGKEAAAKS
ncbi:LPS export ABC transporter permease LptF [Desulfatibacillum aliphaticivorans]|uniref:LPS export ABC transporter permease LptF n=1 Tax=Desulfatibacillum aliphaticivorans TaxID=218208 RepID=UPI00040F4604|nr:LPS export ABC transporter permease LptF [Desulfatibacillum aliphaticivorans]